jgi:hypothetical protein
MHFLIAFINLAIGLSLAGVVPTDFIFLNIFSKIYWQMFYPTTAKETAGYFMAIFAGIHLHLLIMRDADELLQFIYMLEMLMIYAESNNIILIILNAYLIKTLVPQ